MDAERIQTERWNILWAAQRSQRYHSRRTSFYARWNKMTAFAGVLGGSAVFASIGNALPGWVALFGSAAVIVISGADLVAGAAEMARKHNDLRRRFCELEAEIVATEVSTEANVAAWKGQRLAIESDEPPTYVALDILCDNELARSYAHLKEREPHNVQWYKRLTAHLIIWENT